MEHFLNVARRWYDKAVDYEDSFDQFISIWISFNAIYWHREGYEFDKTRSVINELDNETNINVLSYNEVLYFYNLTPSVKFLN